MANLTVRGLDDTVHAQLRIRAAQHGRSMESEVRAILQEQLAPPASTGGLGTRIHSRFASTGYADFQPPPRNDAPRAAVFEE